MSTAKKNDKKSGGDEAKEKENEKPFGIEKLERNEKRVASLGEYLKQSLEKIKSEAQNVNKDIDSAFDNLITVIAARRAELKRRLFEKNCFLWFFFYIYFANVNCMTKKNVIGVQEYEQSKIKEFENEFNLIARYQENLASVCVFCFFPSRFPMGFSAFLCEFAQL